MANVIANGKEIERARIAAGLTQEGLAELAGCAKDTIWRYEQGRSAAVHILELVMTVFRERGIAHGPLWTTEEDPEFRAVGWEELREWEEWGGDPVRLMQDLIDKDVLWNGEWEGYRREFGTPEQWAPLCAKHPDMWQLIVDRNNKIVGHWHFLTLFDEEFARVKAGEWSECSLDESMVQPLLGSGIYNLYVVIIATHPDHRTPKAAGRLVFDSLLRTLTTLAEKKYFFGEVCANAYTAEGVSLCRNFGLVEVAGHRTKGKVWAGRAKDCVARQYVKTDHPRLAELYAANVNL